VTLRDHSLERYLKLLAEKMKKFQTNLAQIGGLRVAHLLQAFIEDEALPGTGISGATFWNGLAYLARDFGEHNRQLLETRDALQSSIDAHHRTSWVSR
jgi:malate synthase